LQKLELNYLTHYANVDNENLGNDFDSCDDDDGETSEITLKIIYAALTFMNVMNNATKVLML